MTKKIMKFVLAFAMIFVLGFESVIAASYPSTIKVSSIGKINYGGTYYFPVKYTSDGTLAYCTEFQDQFPMGVTMSNPKRLEPGVSYIIANGYKGTKADYGNDSKMKQYYITQLAIYTYLGQANPKNNNEVHKAVWDLVNKAKAAKSDDAKLTVSLSANSTKMNLTSDKKYFISDAITVKSNKSTSFSVAASQNVGAFVVDANGNKVTTVKSGSKVYVKMPVTSIKEGQTATISMAAKGSHTKQAAYLYQPGNSSIQNITPGVTYPVTETASASIKVTASRPKTEQPKVTKVKISKKDITTKEELPGAKLVIKDASGNVKASWTSTSTPKYIEGLAAGNYTLCETQAPSGYVLATECIKFTVKADGTVATVIMYNKKEKQPEQPKVTKVKISKKDITTKEELPGAKLVIKDASGKVVESWTSTSTPKYIEGLAAGNYTLCETQAPSGYVLATECIKFTVKADGSVATVIMYNKKETTKVTKVKISKKDITTKEELPGATLVIKDANGKEIEKWVSTNEPKYIEGLAAGNYTLCETQAPEGYVLATECIKFTVKEDGTMSSVIMYNKKEQTPDVPNKFNVKISKQDIATKQELPGATLVVKNSAGVELYRWVSTNEAKYIELEAGTYTLTEIQAPNGYILSTETITFTVKADGSVDGDIIMYNTKAVDVPITASSVSMLVYLIGILGGIFGFTKVVKNA